MVLSGGSEGPTGAWVGAIDLMYRDPSTGKVVVADYKTDAVRPEDALNAASAHAGQGRIYAEAVRRAMCLNYTPVFEVWFIDTDQRLTVPL